MIDFGLQNSVYFPTLGIRPAEMRALQELPDSTKDRMRPIVLFAPWVGARDIRKAIDRFQEAFDERPFYMDLDTAYRSDHIDRPAVADFFEMSESGLAAVERYYSFVESIPAAIPVLRIEQDFINTFEFQMDQIASLDRGFMVRVRKSAFSSGDISALEPLFATGLSNYVFSVDCEWSTDLIDCEVWCRRVIEQITDSGVRVPVLSSLSSFPKSFSDIDGVRVIPIESRILFNNIRRRYSNELEVFYGDWGTTKPREYGGGQTPPARIDYVSEDSWIIYRKKDEWDYFQAAQALIASPFWSEELHIWGSLMIEKTAAGDVSGITTPSKNVAARVNLHLHQQAWFDDPNAMLNTDDPWVDDM